MASKKELSKGLSIEEAFDQIDESISKLENENISLEESFQVYQEGMKLLKSCNEQIDQVEKQVMIINGKGDLDEF